MKNLRFSILVLSLAMLAVGCNKVEKILPKKDGLWNVTNLTSKTYFNNALISTQSDNNPGMTYEFNKDETGTYKDATDTQNFTWSVNADNDVLTICQEVNSITICLDLDIIESSKDAQEWHFTDQQSGSSAWQESELTLERVN